MNFLGLVDEFSSPSAIESKLGDELVDLGRAAEDATESGDTRPKDVALNIEQEAHMQADMADDVDHGAVRGQRAAP